MVEGGPGAIGGGRGSSDWRREEGRPAVEGGRRGGG